MPEVPAVDNGWLTGTCGCWAAMEGVLMGTCVCGLANEGMLYGTSGLVTDGIP
jgi:hypothetical protein